MKLSPWLGTATLLAALLAPPSLLGTGFQPQALGDTLVETAWTLPTTYVSTSYVPTSYVSTSYVVPTSYYVPTVYAGAYYPTSYVLSPTSYYVPSSYYATTYVTRSRSLLRRPVYSATSYYVPTSYYLPTSYYVPTSYYLPTVYDVATTPVSSYATCDDSSTSSTQPAGDSGTRSRDNSRRSSSAESRSTPPSSITSTVPSAPSETDEGTVRADVSEAAPAGERDRAGTLGGIGETPPAPLPATANPARAGDKVNVPPPPAAELPARDRGLPNGAASDEALKNDVMVLPPAADQDRREARRPVLPGPGTNNILAGSVLSKATNAGVPNVRVTATNRLKTHPDQVGKTDALGRFALQLFDGNWTIMVENASGQRVSAKNVSVSGGIVSDDRGRAIRNLEIGR
jgi:hypothetical protein